VNCKFKTAAFIIRRFTNCHHSETTRWLRQMYPLSQNKLILFDGINPSKTKVIESLRQLEPLSDRKVRYNTENYSECLEMVSVASQTALSALTRQSQADESKNVVFSEANAHSIYGSVSIRNQFSSFNFFPPPVFSASKGSDGEKAKDSESSSCEIKLDKKIPDESPSKTNEPPSANRYCCVMM